MSLATSIPYLRRRLDELALAFGLLTRLPLPDIAIRPDVKLGAYIWAFPIAGFVVGLIGAVGLLIARQIGSSAAIAALVAMTVTMLASGALHEDGLADFWDGIGGGRTRERKLEIMRDSRLGSYGAVALFLVLAARWSALSELADPRAAGVAVILAHTLGRGVLALVIEYGRPARTDGLAAEAVESSTTGSVMAILLTVAIAMALAGGAVGLVCLMAAALACGVVGALAQRHLGGYTGDVFGAAEQLAEAAVLVTMAVGFAHQG